MRKHILLVIMIWLVSHAKYAAAQGTPFSQYTGADSGFNITPGWDPTPSHQGPVPGAVGYVASFAACLDPFQGRSVGMGIQFYSNCGVNGPSQIGLGDIATDWNPIYGWEITGESSHHNAWWGYLQDEWLLVSRCDDPINFDPNNPGGASITVVVDIDRGC